MFKKALFGAVLASLSLAASSAGAEILAMMNYESKSPESLQSLKLSGPPEALKLTTTISTDGGSVQLAGVVVVGIDL